MARSPATAIAIVKEMRCKVGTFLGELSLQIAPLALLLGLTYVVDV